MVGTRLGQLVFSATVAILIAGGCGARTSPGSGCGPAATPITQPLIDKVDILFAIDNSASMGDKQELFRDAIPDLLNALLVPDCLNGNQRQKPTEQGGVLACPTGYHFEFPPVHDLHVGIVTSSLGGGGATDVCNGTAAVPKGFVRHDDDRGRLVYRSKPDGAQEDTVLHAKPIDGDGGGFLAWLPSADPKNTGKPTPNVLLPADRAEFIGDFQELVSGVQEYGCGLEAQLESWYRFLVQPDPWDRLEVSGGSPNQPTYALTDVDRMVIKQRKDFLREDSLVAIIMLTDEEDSWSDPLAVGGRGWITRTQNFPSAVPKAAGVMPRPTSECLAPVDIDHPESTGPNDPDCTSCAFAGNKAKKGTPIAEDPECKKPCPGVDGCVGYYGALEDGLNVRYTNDMKRRYGFTPQFPIERYVDGLRSLEVPNREGEHPGGGSYQGKKNCTNPLFARNIPDASDLSSDNLCFLDHGPRTPDLVFFGVIGGVPWQLLVDDPANPKSPFKSSLSDDDWRRIIGADPAHYRTDGIDPHMIESVAPRPGLPPPTAGKDTDPVHGREWRTGTSPIGIDLQYACTFPLSTPRDCSSPAPGASCDCSGPAAGGPEGSPICQGNLQVKGKAYPTIRELRVAKALGAQGIVGSLCPRNATDKGAPDYGYRPVVAAIVDRLRPVLAGQCLPRPLVRTAGRVDCDVLVELPNETNQATACDPSLGFSAPEIGTLTCYRERRLRELQEKDPSATLADVGAVCLLDQIPFIEYQNGTCELASRPGWCYLTGAETGSSCPQALRFSKTKQPPSGSKLSLLCRNP